MIVLIAGATHTGKTLLAQRLLERYAIPYLSIDHLKMGLIRSGRTDLTPEEDDALTAYLWPIVREIIKTAVENGQNLTVEGCYVPADWRRDFDEKVLPSVRFICLAMTDGFIDTHFPQIREHSCDIEKRLDDADCAPERLKQDNRLVRERFDAAGESVTLIDADYDSAILSVLDSVLRE